MARMPGNPAIPLALLQLLRVSDEGAPGLEERMRLVQTARGRSAAQAEEIDRLLVEEIACLSGGLREAQANQEKLKAVLDKLAAIPWHPAVYIRPVTTTEGSRVVVVCGGSQRIVGLAEDVKLDSLVMGDEVFLSDEKNVVLAKSPYGVPQCGEVAAYLRTVPNGRIVLQRRSDEEVVVDVGGQLQDVELQTGDLLRWQRDSWMAFERLPRVEGSRFLMEEVRDIGRDQVGGQGKNLDMLVSTLTITLVAPEKAIVYGLNGRQTILMVGFPGCGKTLMARVVAAEIARTTGKRCRFAVVKPGELEDPFVGMTQRNIRELFEGLDQAAKDGLVILFLDEVESVGRTRGGLTSQHSDKFLGAWLAEIDGFADRSGVAIIAATNRKDLIDPALLERLSDVEIPVGRPDMRGAREIFEIHLPESLPYSSQEGTAGETRCEIIDRAVSRFYCPNAENELCVVRFRDGKTRTIKARELASGRCFEQISRAARQAAAWRDISCGEAGLRVADIETAVSDAMQRLTSTLTPRNVHAYLSDLPQDVDVVSVEPIVHRVKRPHRYLNLQVA